MNQFTFMVDTLYGEAYADILSSDELLNTSLAFVESTLLNGYNITDIAEYQTRTKRVTTRMN